MELALLERSASSDRRPATATRIKLQFSDRSILSSWQLEEGLHESWFYLHPNIRTIADLAAGIISAFNLLKTCPHGILLRMEDFALPPSQPVWLLKDKDLVCINKKVGTSNFAREGINHANSSSLDTYDRIGPPGVKLYAFEEFDREMGGYESEKEEDAKPIPDGELCDITKSVERRSTKSKKKKRKHDDLERDDREEEKLKLQVVPYTAPTTVKKSKKQNPLVDKQSQEELLEKSHKSKKTKSPKVKKNRKGIADNTTNVTEDNHGDTAIKSKNASRSTEMNASVSTSDASSCSEKEHGDEGKSERDAPVETVKKLSRSTLRKKAKRRWKREHKKELASQLNPRSAEGGPCHNFSMSMKLDTKGDDDGEAEEERLPIVVKPGHIRFEPLDEDEGGGEPESVPKLHSWNNCISKRKGQSWGQEKTKKEHESHRTITNFEYPTSEIENTCSEVIEFEAFPHLVDPLQIGDIIAYRVVELGPSLCPELSEYRVGKVVHIDNISGIVELGECEKYPLKKMIQESDLDTYGLLAVSYGYGDVGNIEIERSSLVDVRVVEKSNSDIQMNMELTHKGKCGLKDESKSEVPVTMELVENVSKYNTQANHFNEKTEAISSLTVKSAPANSGSQLSVEHHSAWQEITEELGKKKEELIKKDGSPSPSIQSADNKEVDKSSAQKTINRSRPWLRRAGGLGATMAMLRSQVSSES